MRGAIDPGRTECVSSCLVGGRALRSRGTAPRGASPWSAGALVLLLAGCVAERRTAEGESATGERTPEAPVPADLEWDRELPAGWVFHDFVDEDAEVPAGAAPAVSNDGPGRSRVPEVAVVALRVVDGASGEPVAGARVDNWLEAETPHAEPWEDLRCGSWTTDIDGRAVVPATDRAPWYYVDAPGYAPLAEMALQDEYRLVRGRDVTLEVRDWRDRPAPGAVLDYVLGCGHTPNARCETAGPDARLVLRCVDDSRGDLWIRAEGIAGRNDGYGGWEDLPERDGVRLLRGDPGPVLEGLVLRADGTPAAGARVGSLEAHRGPWTVAGSDGRYRLLGAQPLDELVAMAPVTDPVPDGVQSPQVEFLSVPGVFATVRLPAEGRPWPTAEETEARRVQRRAEREAYERGEEPEPAVAPEGPGIRVRVDADADADVAPGVAPSGRVTILLVRDGDGAAQKSSPLFRDGAATRAVAVGPGKWTVTAGDAAGALRPAAQRVEVTSGWTEVAFTLEPNPVWTPHVVEDLADGTRRDTDVATGGHFRIVSDSGEVRATTYRGASGDEVGTIHVPAAGPFAVEYRADDGRRARVLLDGPPAGEGPTLVLPVRVEDDDWDDSDERPREFAAAALHVLLPDGSPAAGVRVTVRTALPPDAGARDVRRRDERTVDLDDAGSAICDFDRGDALEARGFASEDDTETVLPLFARIDAPGPWTIRWPTGGVDVSAVDENGATLTEFAVSLLGWDTIDPVDGVVRLRGVGTSPLRFLVGAPGRRTHDLRLLLAPGEMRTVTVRLRPSDAN